MSAASSEAPSTAGFSSQRGGRIELGLGTDMRDLREERISVWNMREGVVKACFPNPCRRINLHLNQAAGGFAAMGLFLIACRIVLCVAHVVVV
jgi:hypothetical protein